MDKHEQPIHGAQNQICKRADGLKETQMSETIQFMVGAAQTVTSGVLPSYRSDAQESQLIGNNHHL